MRRVNRRWLRTTLLLWGLVLLVAADSMALQRSAPRALALTNVTVLDVRDGSLVQNQTVVVTGTRITAVGPTGTVRLPPRAQVVDARSKYLIPGLWDMHIHVFGFPEVFYPLLVANGVTGIRDMGTAIPLDSVHQWQREIAAGVRVGPRQLNAGNPLDVESGSFCARGTSYASHCPLPYPFHLATENPARARYLVDSLHDAGADLIKMYIFNSREVYFAAAAEARRVGIPFGGHLQVPDVTILDAADSGQRTFEHWQGLDGWCMDHALKMDSIQLEARCATVAARLRQHNAWVVDALLLNSLFSPTSDQTARELRAQLRYWPDSVTRHAWLADSSPDFVPSGEARRAPFRIFLARARRVGLPMLAGTDGAPSIPEQVPGFALQNDVVLLAEAGLTPLEALQTATLNPAKYLNGTDSLGTVAAGKLADLVLLDANPLADIHHLRQIRAVVANGRYFDRAALDTLLAHVERGGAAHWAR